MGKVNCKCGWQISDVSSPTKEKGWFLSDYALDEKEEWTDLDIIDAAREVWICSQCGRVAVVEKNGNRVRWYEPAQD